MDEPADDMRITQHTDYALRVLIYLALRTDERSTIREISEAYAISRNHLMKVVQKLVAAGYVEATRGAGGGLMLARRPEAIGIGKVVRELEPDFGLVECFRPDNACVITPACRLPAMLDEALTAFHRTLDGYTLADIATPDRRDGLKVLLKI